MSLERVAEITQDLPPKLREDVLGYARGVRDSLSDIFHKAGVQEDAQLGDQLVFVSGIKKLYAICSVAFWIVDNSLTALGESDVTAVKLGSTVISRGSRDWRQLHDAFSSLEELLTEKDLFTLIREPSYAVILDQLRHGG